MFSPEIGKAAFYLIHMLKVSIDKLEIRTIATSIRFRIWLCNFRITGAWNNRLFDKRFESKQSENLNTCPARPEVQYCTIEHSWLLKGLWCTSFARLWSRKIRYFASLASKNVIPRAPSRDITVVLFSYSSHIYSMQGTFLLCMTRNTLREIYKTGLGFSKQQRWGWLQVVTISGLLTVYDDLNVPEKRTAFD